MWDKEKDNEWLGKEGKKHVILGDIHPKKEIQAY